MDKTSRIPAILEQIGQTCPSGYAIALHVWFTTPRFLFQTYDPEWTARYTRRGYIMHDPTVRWGFENQGLCNWSDLEDQDSHKVFEDARAYGLNHGFALSITTHGSRTLAGFTRPDRPHSQDEIAQIQTLMNQLHDITADIETLTDADTAALRAMNISLNNG